MPRIESGFRRKRLNDGGKTTKKSTISRQKRYGARWHRETRIFLAHNPLCVDCEGRGLVNEARVVDHIRPHRGDDRVFWDATNWQALCISCHNRKSAQENAGSNTKPSHRPNWMSQAKIPVTLVCGAPGSGRQRYVENRRGPNELVISLPEILAGGVNLKEAIQVRNSTLGKLTGPYACQYERAWWIDEMPRAPMRQWWADRFGCEVVVLHRPEAECILNLKKRGQSDQIPFAVRWHREFSTNFLHQEIQDDA